MSRHRRIDYLVDDLSVLTDLLIIVCLLCWFWIINIFIFIFACFAQIVSFKVPASVVKHGFHLALNHHICRSGFDPMTD